MSGTAIKDASELDPNIACVIPDCFSPDGDAYPAQYRPFQELNVELSRENGRKSSIKTTMVRSARGWLARPSLRYWGLAPRSIRQVVKLLLAALRGKPERLRCAQFPLVAQIFVDNLRRHRPDVGVLFTNHVAIALDNAAALLTRITYLRVPRQNPFWGS